MNPFYFVLLAGLSAGIYQILRKTASARLDTLLAATLFSFFAGILGLFLLYLRNPKLDLRSLYNLRMLTFLAAGGLLVLSIDYFIIKAYGKGFPISLGSVMLTALSSVTAILFGTIFLDENLNFMKLFGIILIIFGVFILKY